MTAITSTTSSTGWPTMARLVAALVNEQLVASATVHLPAEIPAAIRALFLDENGPIAKLVPLGTNKDTALYIKLTPRPVPAATTNPIPFLDPTDIVGPHVVLTTPLLSTSSDPAANWTAFAAPSHGTPFTSPTAVARIAHELGISARVQSLISTLPLPRTPSLDADPVVWEHAVVEGHPMHPMHRARAARERPRRGRHVLFPGVRFVAVLRTAVGAHGTFGAEVEPAMHKWVRARVVDDEEAVALVDDPSRTLLPIHPLHVPVVAALFPAPIAHLLSATATLKCAAQASLRTVVPLDLTWPLLAYAIKLPVFVVTTSALRTVSAPSAHNGPVISQIAHLATTDVQNVLTVLEELAACGSIHADPDVAKALAAIFRHTTPRGFVVCAALVERAVDSEVPHGARFVPTGSETRWIARYADVLLSAFLPPYLVNGLAFEAHLQNTLVRLDHETGVVMAFAVRDFGGIDVHTLTFAKRHGRDLIDRLHPQSPILADSMRAGAVLLYHALIMGHVHRLVRVLVGDVNEHPAVWKAVREVVERHVPRGSVLEEVWLKQRTVPGKAFLRMKLLDTARDTK
ncbi:hypothetical protein AMAG_03911 [Allomyces macrogynus ATCC 38327]|uniref:Aerobactin siderophore biosynthesis IucA/IucC N-terminal domain-containing protein n=1 Tax=Allomyces macrogynus (strain ATCC 38327) TaxID=578462 RepID=A0A0L0S6T6_ALLM3|nr:hypothetical protein AMAG_03911 [Allomyces macrogynus ATCC 38327]|eukprot:KNE58323.1 hypothetical protein AMAG_03911 [Allomyces macrogynus ATCC 38327]